MLNWGCKSRMKGEVVSSLSNDPHRLTHCLHPHSHSLPFKFQFLFTFLIRTGKEQHLPLFWCSIKIFHLPSKSDSPRNQLRGEFLRTSKCTILRLQCPLQSACPSISPRDRPQMTPMNQIPWGLRVDGFLLALYN